MSNKTVNKSKDIINKILDLEDGDKIHVHYEVNETIKSINIKVISIGVRNYPVVKCTDMPSLEKSESDDNIYYLEPRRDRSGYNLVDMISNISKSQVTKIEFQ